MWVRHIIHLYHDSLLYSRSTSFQSHGPMVPFESCNLFLILFISIQKKKRKKTPTGTLETPNFQNALQNKVHAQLPICRVV